MRSVCECDGVERDGFERDQCEDPARVGAKTGGGPKGEGERLGEDEEVTNDVKGRGWHGKTQLVLREHEWMSDDEGRRQVGDVFGEEEEKGIRGSLSRVQVLGRCLAGLDLGLAAQAGKLLLLLLPTAGAGLAGNLITSWPGCCCCCCTWPGWRLLAVLAVNVGPVCAGNGNQLFLFQFCSVRCLGFPPFLTK